MTTLLEKYIAKVEANKEKRDFTGEEWPRETQAEADGWNSALAHIQSLLPELIKEVATEIVADLLWEVDSPNPSMLVIRNKLVARLASLNDVIKDWDKQADDLTNGREPNIK